MFHCKHTIIGKIESITRVNVSGVIVAYIHNTANQGPRTEIFCAVDSVFHTEGGKALLTLVRTVYCPIPQWHQVLHLWLASYLQNNEILVRFIVR